MLDGVLSANIVPVKQALGGIEQFEKELKR